MLYTGTLGTSPGEHTICTHLSTIYPLPAVYLPGIRIQYLFLARLEFLCKTRCVPHYFQYKEVTFLFSPKNLRLKLLIIRLLTSVAYCSMTRSSSSCPFVFGFRKSILEVLRRIYHVLIMYSGEHTIKYVLLSERLYNPTSLASAVHPVSVLIVHPRDIQILWSGCETEKNKNKIANEIKVGKSSAKVPSMEISTNTTTNTPPNK